MSNVVEYVNIAGAIASSGVAIILFLGTVCAKTTTGKKWFKNWVKRTFGIMELTEKMDVTFKDFGEKIDNHLAVEAEMNEHMKHQGEAILSILRKEIKQMCEECIEKESVSVKDREMIVSAYKSYKNLMGNSFIHGLVDKTLDLPLDSNMD